MLSCIVLRPHPPLQAVSVSQTVGPGARAKSCLGWLENSHVSLASEGQGLVLALGSLATEGAAFQPGAWYCVISTAMHLGLVFQGRETLVFP